MALGSNSGKTQEKQQPTHLENLLSTMKTNASNSKSIEDESHRGAVGDIASNEPNLRPSFVRRSGSKEIPTIQVNDENVTASHVRTPIAGRDVGGAAKNAAYRGEGSSNATENTGKFQGTVEGRTFNVAAVKTYNRGSLGMVDHKKALYAQFLLFMSNHGKDLGSDRLLRIRLPALDMGIARVKNEVEKDLKAKIREEVLRCA
ncbi:MAG: hypothetical protein VXZ73_02040, partial [Pseudomonadota bacterium]|nr:hypothetical protein [Pseudomonadota bacterium]